MNMHRFNKLILLPLCCLESAIVILGVAGAFSCNIGFAVSSLILYNMVFLPALFAALVLGFFYNKLNFKLFITVTVLQLYPFVLLFLTKYIENDELWANIVWSSYLLISIAQTAIIFRVKKFNMIAGVIVLSLNFIQCVFFLMVPS